MIRKGAGWWNMEGFVWALTATYAASSTCCPQENRPLHTTQASSKLPITPHIFFPIAEGQGGRHKVPWPFKFEPPHFSRIFLWYSKTTE